MRAVVLATGLAMVLGACRAPTAATSACSGGVCEAACPRDSVLDGSGRCACQDGDLRVLGACVPAPVADAYCGHAGRASEGGCTFATCGADEAVDLDLGCVPVVSLAHSGAGTCPAGASLVVASRVPACVPPDAACPRGTLAEGARCARPPRCPAGTLGDGYGRGPASTACRPVVVARQGGSHVVDVGAWAALVLGVDGGPGSRDLCRPLEARPAAFGLDRGATVDVDVLVAVTVPDEDLSRVEASVRLTSAHPLPPAAAAVAQASVATLVEPLRGLAGASSASRVAARLRCTITSL